jgi:hypothetical protein
LPADEQITPRRFCSSVSCANLFMGPRNLVRPAAREELRLEADVEAGALAEQREVRSGV